MRLWICQFININTYCVKEIKWLINFNRDLNPVFISKCLVHTTHTCMHTQHTRTHIHTTHTYTQHTHTQHTHTHTHTQLTLSWVAAGSCADRDDSVWDYVYLWSAKGYYINLPSTWHNTSDYICKDAIFIGIKTRSIIFHPDLQESQLLLYETHKRLKKGIYLSIRGDIIMSLVHNPLVPNYPHPMSPVLWTKKHNWREGKKEKL